MIDVKELRMGNWLSARLNPLKRETQPVGFVVDENTFETASSHPDWYDPIPLTREILEKCGFKYYAWPDFLQFSHFIQNDFILRQTDSRYSVFNTSKCDDSKRQHMVIVEYLHQLQNLYFALTGEELTINHKAPSQHH